MSTNRRTLSEVSSVASTTSRWIDACAFALLLAVVVLAPVPWGSFDPWIRSTLATACLLVCGLTMLACAVGGRTPSLAQLPLLRPIACLVLFAVWAWVHALWISVEPERSLHSAIWSSALAAVAAATVELLRNPRRQTVLLATILFVGVVQAVIALWLYFNDLRWQFPDARQVSLNAATGTFFNRNQLAMQMVIAFACGLALMLSHLSTATPSWLAWFRGIVAAAFTWKGLVRIALVLLVIALVLSRSRAGNSGLLIASMLCVIAWGATARTLSKGFVVLFASIVLIDIAVIGTLVGAERVVERFEAGELQGATNVRVELMTAASQMAMHYLPLGSGPGTFGIGFFPFRTADLKTGYLHAHNDYLQILIEYGVPGFVILGGFVALIGTAILRGLRGAGPAARGISAATLFLIVYTMWHSAVEFVLFVPSLALHMVVILSIALVANSPSGDARGSP